MNPLSFCLVAAIACVAASSCHAATQTTATGNARDLQDEMQLINKSLEGLLGELATIKREATGRLSQVRSKLVGGEQQASEQAADKQHQAERIRQTKVSRFVLKRVAELELESLGMRDEMVRLFELQRKTLAAEKKAGEAGSLSGRSAGAKQEDFDFDAPASSPAAPVATSSSAATTLKPAEAEEASQIGFDLEQLKRLGSELEAELEARQAQGAESVRGVHEQLIKLVDNMVQNYLGNMRRAVQRFTNFIDNTRARQPATSQQQPRESPNSIDAAPSAQEAGAHIVGQLEALTKRFREFTMQWSKTLGRQQSPLIDRIPPRGVELWRDFWDTVRKQVRRINEEFWQLSRDMGRMLTGRQPGATGTRVVVRPREGEAEPNAVESAAGASLGQLLYSSQAASDKQLQQEQIRQQFEEFYEKLTIQLAREQQKMNELSKTGTSGNEQQKEAVTKDKESTQLLDELDDEVTRQELAHNIALRQQIQQEINVFGSIFDIMRAFIARLRDSATTIRDILTPPGAIFDNNPVTPGPEVKPTVDKLLEETVNSQRKINSQARPTSRD